MARITNIKNGNYIGANKYTIKDAGQGKSTIDFSPDSILEEGTPVGAEILNEIQKNGLYYLEGTKRVSGQEDIYDCTLEGLTDFDYTQLVVLFKPNANSTNSTVKLNISGVIYTVNTSDNKFYTNERVGLLLIKSEMKAYSWVDMSKKQDKTDQRLKTKSKEVVGAINEIMPYRGTVNNLETLNNAIENGYYIVSNFSVTGNVYEYGTLIVWSNGLRITQMYIPDEVGKGIHTYSDSMVIRSTWTGNIQNNEWTQILNTKSKLFLGNSGITAVKYIQDNIPKNKNEGYIDDVTGKLYLCIETTTDITITDKFIPADNISNAYKMAQGNGLGYNQKWKNVTSNRAKDTVYTNNTSKPIMVSINCSIGTDFDIYLYVDDIVIDGIHKEREGYYSATLQAIVPPNSTYKFTQIGNSTIKTWLELR